MFYRLIRFFFCLLLLFGKSNGSTSYLHQFELPLFDKYGRKSCNICGEKADILNDKMFQILNISIETFPLKNTSNSNFLAISDQAMVDVEGRRVSGNGFITITNNIASVMGQKWEFSSDEKTFILGENVQVFF